jgi:hypothetical protein
MLYLAASTGGPLGWVSPRSQRPLMLSLSKHARNLIRIVS